MEEFLCDDKTSISLPAKVSLHSILEHASHLDEPINILTMLSGAYCVRVFYNYCIWLWHWEKGISNLGYPMHRWTLANFLFFFVRLLFQRHRSCISWLFCFFPYPNLDPISFPTPISFAHVRGREELWGTLKQCFLIDFSGRPIKSVFDWCIHVRTRSE